MGAFYLCFAHFRGRPIEVNPFHRHLPKMHARTLIDLTSNGAISFGSPESRSRSKHPCVSTQMDIRAPSFSLISSIFNSRFYLIRMFCRKSAANLSKVIQKFPSELCLETFRWEDCVRVLIRDISPDSSIILRYRIIHPQCL